MKLLAAFLPLAFSACLLPFGEREEVLAGVSPDRVLAVAREVVESDGYAVNAGATTGGLISTEWQNEMNLAYRGGVRRRVEIRAESGDGGTKLGVKVVREVNDTMTYSLDPAKARWISGGRDEDLEHAIALRTKMKLDLLALKWQD